MSSWEYRVGDCVDHQNGSMTAIVLARTRTLAGAESYSVRLVDQEDERRDRVIRAEYMKRVVAGLGCVGCRFWRGECYRDGS